MTVAEVRERVAAIAASDDPEAAHSMEDALYIDVLRHVAKGFEQDRGPTWIMGYDNDREIAVEALKAAEIVFHRWCA